MAATHEIDEVATWRGRDAVGPDGEKIGTIDEVYLDQETGKPEWLAVKTGLFGSNLSFVPLAEASAEGDGDVRLPYDKGKVKDAPNAEADGQLSQEEERRLYEHYGLGYSEYRSDSGLPQGGTGVAGGDGGTVDRDRDVVGDDVSGPETDRAMTRSEEELRVGKTQQEAGRVRLRKFVTTETETVNVPVSREEVRIEREPITDANADAAYDGPAISEEEHEVVLHEEQAVVGKEAVAKERVRLDKDVVTEDQQVTEDVRKEHIEVDGDVDVDTRR